VAGDLRLSAHHADIAQEINDWMHEQERYEQQLYQLSQRLMLQSQLNDQQAQRQARSSWRPRARQGLENALQALSLSLPKKGRSRLAARSRKRICPVAGATDPTWPSEQIAALKPLLETLPPATR
jgi:exonuclease SbcC